MFDGSPRPQRQPEGPNESLENLCLTASCKALSARDSLLASIFSDNAHVSVEHARSAVEHFDRLAQDVAEIRAKLAKPNPHAEAA
jgi:hypothetical protein